MIYESVMAILIAVVPMAIFFAIAWDMDNIERRMMEDSKK